MKKISGHKAVISLLISLWVVVTVVVLDLFRIEVYWPTFAVLNLLTLIGFNRKNIIKIFLSCFSGIGISLLYMYLRKALAPHLGETVSGLLVLFLVILIVLVFDETLPICFNVHTIIVFAYCLVDAHGFTSAWLHTIISAVLGGGVGIAGVLGIIKLSPRLNRKRAEPSAE